MNDFGKGFTGFQHIFVDASVVPVYQYFVVILMDMLKHGEYFDNFFGSRSVEIIQLKYHLSFAIGVFYILSEPIQNGFKEFFGIFGHDFSVKLKTSPFFI